MTVTAEDRTVLADGDEAPAAPAAPSDTYARRENLVAAGTTSVVGVAAVFGAFGLGIGSFSEPGAGLWPAVVGAAMAITSLALLVNPRHSGTEERFSREATLVVIGVLSLFAYALLFERLGFEIPTLALIVLWMKVIGREKWRPTLTVSVATTAAIYALFITGLGVNLPHVLVF
jgi:integral membrane sensor domain MASE1